MTTLLLAFGGITCLVAYGLGIAGRSYGCVTASVESSACNTAPTIDDNQASSPDENLAPRREHLWLKCTRQDNECRNVDIELTNFINYAVGLSRGRGVVHAWKPRPSELP